MMASATLFVLLLVLHASAGCDLVCLHGGQPDAECTSCSCPDDSAWTARAGKQVLTHVSKDPLHIPVFSFLCNGHDHVYSEPLSRIGLKNLTQGQSFHIDQRLVDDSGTYFLTLTSAGDLAIYANVTSNATMFWNHSSFVTGSNYSLALDSLTGVLVVLVTTPGGVQRRVVSNNAEPAACAKVMPDGRLHLFADAGCQRSVWASTLPRRTPPGCLLQGKAFFTDGHNSVPVYELFADRDSDHTYMLTPPYATSSPVFYGMTESVAPLYMSKLCINGWCDTAFSTNATWDSQCSHWDDSMPLAALLGSHQKVVNMSKNALASNTQSICTLNQQCTGWGIDAVTGAPASATVVSLTYNNPTHVATNGKLWPDSMKAVRQQTNWQSPSIDCSLANVNTQRNYPFATDFVSTGSQAYTSQNQGLGTANSAGASGDVFSMSYEDVFKKYYAAGTGMSEFRAGFPLITLTLDAMPSGDYNTSLDPYFMRALEMMPPDMATDKRHALWSQHFADYGTGVITSSEMGGVVSQVVTWNSLLSSEFTSTQMSEFVETDFNMATGLCSTGQLSPDYASGRTLEPLFCAGGLEADLAMCSLANMSQWISGIQHYPRVIRVLDWQPTHIFLQRDAAYLSESYRNAMSIYVQDADTAWANYNKCPTCGHGTCTFPSESCVCPPTFSGRTCTDLL